VVFQAWFAAAFTILVLLRLPYLSGSVKTPLTSVPRLLHEPGGSHTDLAISILFLFIILLPPQEEKALFQQVRLFPPFVLWGSVVLGITAIVVAIVNTLLYPG